MSTLFGNGTKATTTQITTLPSKPTPPNIRTDTISAIIAGDLRIGKSTFAASLPKPLIIATEPGLGALETYQVQVQTWEQFIAVLRLLAKGDHDFQTIVIDTVDPLWHAVGAWTVERFKGQSTIQHVSQFEHGKGWGIAGQEFDRVMRLMMQLQMGKYFLTHIAKIRDTEKLGPSLATPATRILTRLVDLIAYAKFQIVSSEDPDQPDTSARILQLAPSAAWVSGCRFQHLLPDYVVMEADNPSRQFTEALAEASIKSKKEE